jgi:hypothetical protein
MSRLPQRYAWLEALTSAFTNLSLAQVRGLAWFSFGMVLQPGVAHAGQRR